MQPVHAIAEEERFPETEFATDERPAVLAGRRARLAEGSAREAHRPRSSQRQPRSRASRPGLRASRPGLRASLYLLRACRPGQWLKNAVVLLAPAAAGAFSRPGASTSAWVAAIAFCLLSSAATLAQHARSPGRVDERLRSRLQMVRLAVGFGAVGVLCALVEAPALAGLALCYLALATSYPAWSERVPSSGAVALTAGLILRAVAGDLAVGTPIQVSFLLLVGACAFAVATVKRRVVEPPPELLPHATWVRARRILAVALVVLVADVFISFAASMSAPSNTPFGVRAVEWLRGNGAAWLVSDVENIYYSWNAPATGGPALKQLPRVGNAHIKAVAGYRPPRIAPVIHPALPGEGAWHGTGPLVHNSSPVLVTTFRPDPSYPQLVAGVAWIDHSLTRLELYPGRYEPPDAGQTPAEVPMQLRGALLATFNSGFRLEDDLGGFVSSGHVYEPLKDGQATLVGYRNGRVDIQTWHGGADPGREVEFARQNLRLIVSGGRLNPSLSNPSLWGATVGNAVRVWRSGIGVDAHGNLIYAAADIQTAQSLAQILKRAGAVRAMELDINYDWTTFNFYGEWGAGRPQKLLPGMSRPATRYLTPDDRDFFAVYARGSH
jgi:hypothetical protein